MGKLLDAVPITLPPPVGGINRKSPLANMPQTQSPWLLNVDCYPQSIKVRNGYVIHSTVTTAGPGPYGIFALGVYGSKADSANNKLFCYLTDNSGTHKIYDVTASVEVIVTNPPADDSVSKVFPFNYAKRLAFITETDWFQTARVFEGGASWRSWMFQDGGVEVGGPVATSYKGRVYFFSGTTMYYSAQDEVGTDSVAPEDTTAQDTTSYDLQYVFEEAAEVVWAGILSSARQTNEEIFLAIGNAAGEVLIYGGLYPGSSTWGLVGRFKTSAPTGYNSIIKYANDLWVITETGIVSIRDLFNLGSIAAVEQTVSDSVNPYWTELVKELLGGYWQPPPKIDAAYWPERNQILVILPGHIDKDGVFDDTVATMCVYNTIARAWSFHSLEHIDAASVGGPTYFNGNVYFFTKNVVMKVNLTGYKDETYDSAGTYSAISYEIQGAYSSYGNDSVNKKVVAFQPIIKTDFAGTSVGMRAVSDMGRQSSDLCKVELVDGYNIPYYSVGAEGTYIQYRIEGDSDITSTDGLELLSITSFVVPGGRG